MQNRTLPKEKEPLGCSTVVTRIILVFLSLTLALGIVTLTATLREELQRSQAEADDFFYSVQSGDYQWLSSLKQRPMSDKTREEVAGCIAVSYYYEAAVYYKAYVDAGRKEQAAEQKAKMEALLPVLKEYSLSFAAEDIQTTLELK